MNLQVCVPYEKCPYNCPMCIASGRKQFKNEYDEDEEYYFSQLEKIADNYDNFIITGATDPTLNKAWLENIIDILYRFGNVELQTRNYNLKGFDLKGLSTLAYSITTIKDFLRAWKFKKLENGNNRLVILLTKEFDFLTADNFNPMGYNQITFKVLQKTADEKTNKWIDENEMKDFANIYNIINKYNGEEVSVRIDTNCQDSHGRYEIFREDGLLYKKWEDETPIER